MARRIGLLGSWKSRFPSLDASYSSLDTVTWNTARALERRGVEAVVAGAEIAPANDAGADVELVPVHAVPDWLMRTGCQRLHLPSRLRPRWSTRHHHPFHVFEGVAALRRRGVDAIQMTHEFANLAPARWLAGPAALITQLHAVWVDDHPELARRLLAADAVATVSDFVRDAICNVEPRLEGRASTVRNGVDLNAFPGRAAIASTHGDAIAAWRRRLDACDRPLVLAVGRVAPEKGHHVLAQAAARLIERGHDPVVVVAGPVGGAYERPGRAQSPLWRDIEALVPGYAERTQADAGRATFRLLGTTTPDDVRLLLAAADVFVAPSLTPEPCPLPILEALAMEAPAVTSDTGGYPELVGSAALLVPPDDPDALADALARLLDDAGFRTDLGARARPQAARHTWDATAAALDALVTRLT
jgi:glycosyltransferase involved in cell wall biosynthesis